jgi:hypothetical protein
MFSLSPNLHLLKNLMIYGRIFLIQSPTAEKTTTLAQNYISNKKNEYIMV